MKPSYVSSSGSRFYTDRDFARLQQILLLKELEFPLKEIAKILSSPGFDREKALDQQIELLLLKKEHLEQLISFARAVLADPAIFVLDEATSSIDTQTEHLIQNAIARLLQGRTSFLIAHRLSTIRHADVILVVKDGKIIERGSHEELLHKKGYYFSLYTKQFEKEASAQILHSN